jgi:hypothetical protein
MYTYHYQDPDFKHCVVDSSRLQTENVRDKFLYNMGLNMKMVPTSSFMVWNLLYKQSEESKSSIWLMVIWSNDWNSKTKGFFYYGCHLYIRCCFLPFDKKSRLRFVRWPNFFLSNMQVASEELKFHNLTMKFFDNDTKDHPLRSYGHP